MFQLFWLSTLALAKLENFESDVNTLIFVSETVSKIN